MSLPSMGRPAHKRARSSGVPGPPKYARPVAGTLQFARCEPSGLDYVCRRAIPASAGAQDKAMASTGSRGIGEMASTDTATDAFDTSVAHIARVYDYLLG